MKREEIIHSFGNPQIIAEVGVLRGYFASKLLETNPNELHLIDPWQPFPGYNDYKKDARKWEETYQSVVKRFSGNPKVKIHRLTSVKGSQQFADAYFDFVYIDANHSYEHVKEDIQAWLPKVKPGGIIGGHDIDIKHGGVKRAVEEIFGPGSWIETTEYDENTVGRKYAKSWFVKR